MKEKKQITDSEAFNLTPAVVFEIFHLKNGKHVVYSRINLKNYHTPLMQCCFIEMKICRKGMKFLGYIKSERKTTLIYKPQKVVA